MHIRFIHFSISIIFLFSFFGCSSTQAEQKTNQLAQLSAEERLSFTEKIIRYLGKKPEDASHETKFDPYFDTHYEKQLNNYKLEYYYKDSSGKHYFIYTYIAPSLYLKKTAVGGLVSLSKSGTVEKYEEQFRTWKQKPEVLQPITDTLFTKLLAGETLAPYYTKNSENLGWIEFPNDEVHFDTETFYWVSSRIDPLESFHQEKIKQTEKLIKQNK